MEGAGVSASFQMILPMTPRVGHRGHIHLYMELQRSVCADGAASFQGADARCAILREISSQLARLGLMAAAVPCGYFLCCCSTFAAKEQL